MCDFMHCGIMGNFQSETKDDQILEELKQMNHKLVKKYWSVFTRTIMQVKGGRQRVSLEIKSTLSFWKIHFLENYDEYIAICVTMQKGAEKYVLCWEFLTDGTLKRELKYSLIVIIVMFIMDLNYNKLNSCSNKTWRYVFISPGN